MFGKKGGDHNFGGDDEDDIPRGANGDIYSNSPEDFLNGALRERTNNIKKDMKALNHFAELYSKLPLTFGPGAMAATFQTLDFVPGIEENDKKDVQAMIDRAQARYTEMYLDAPREFKEKQQELFEQMREEFKPGIDPAEYYAQLKDSQLFIEGTVKAINAELSKIAELERTFLGI